MSTPKPSDLPHQRLQAVKQPTPLDRSLGEVEDLMERFLNHGYNTTEAIQLTDLTLSNIVEEGL